MNARPSRPVMVKNLEAQLHQLALWSNATWCSTADRLVSCCAGFEQGFQFRFKLVWSVIKVERFDVAAENWATAVAAARCGGWGCWEAWAVMFAVRWAARCGLCSVLLGLCTHAFTPVYGAGANTDSKVGAGEGPTFKSLSVAGAGLARDRLGWTRSL
jgi:hypothetical protein